MILFHEIVSFLLLGPENEVRGFKTEATKGTSANCTFRAKLFLALIGIVLSDTDQQFKSGIQSHFGMTMKTRVRRKKTNYILAKVISSLPLSTRNIVQSSDSFSSTKQAIELLSGAIQHADSESKAFLLTALSPLVSLKR